MLTFLGYEIGRIWEYTLRIFDNTLGERDLMAFLDKFPFQTKAKYGTSNQTFGGPPHLVLSKNISHERAFTCNPSSASITCCRSIVP